MKWVVGVDQFAANLFEAGAPHLVTMNHVLAKKLLEEFSRHFKGKDYKEVRNMVLALNFLEGRERDAYKDFLDLFFLNRARAAKAARNRPIAPVNEDGHQR